MLNAWDNSNERKGQSHSTYAIRIQLDSKTLPLYCEKFGIESANLAICQMKLIDHSNSKFRILRQIKISVEYWTPALLNNPLFIPPSHY